MDHIIKNWVMIPDSQGRAFLSRTVTRLEVLLMASRNSRADTLTSFESRKKRKLQVISPLSSRRLKFASRL